MAVERIRWWGHAAVELVSGQGAVLFADPWLASPASTGAVADVERVDAILVTHDHFDHSGDTVELAGRGEPLIACQPEVAALLREQGVPTSRFVGGGIGMNIGGTVDISGFRVTMTPAWHSSGRGTPAGFIIRMPSGLVVYHAGDTSVFGDMELLGRLYDINVALLPIGGHFTMDAVEAAEATRLISPRAVVPIHFGTFGLLAPNADEFRDRVARVAPRTEVIVLEPGQYRDLPH